MMKLFRYEMIKTRVSKFIVLGITAAMELIFLLGLILNNDMIQITGALLLLWIAVVGIVWIGIVSVITLHRDMNSRRGYMLFMTPNSSYRILGAKYLENGLSILIAAAFFGALGVLDITLLFRHHQELDQISEVMHDLFSAIFQNISLDPASIISFLVYLVFDWLFTISLAYLAVIVCTSLMNGKKGNMFLSFLLFLVLDIGFSLLFSVLIPGKVEGGTMVGSFLARSGLCLAITAVFYWLNATIMDKKLSV